MACGCGTSGRKRPAARRAASADAAEGATGTVLVMSGDGLTDCDLTGLAQRHRQGGGMVSLVLKRLDKPEEYGVCELAADGRIVRFTEKPGTAAAGSLVNTGIYFLEPEALDWIPARGAATSAGSCCRSWSPRARG